MVWQCHTAFVHSDHAEVRERQEKLNLLITVTFCIHSKSDNIMICLFSTIGNKHVLLYDAAQNLFAPIYIS